MDKKTDPCEACLYRKRVGSMFKGKRIPGRAGKCIRPEGLCEDYEQWTKILGSFSG
jgi:hypothetical protein